MSTVARPIRLRVAIVVVAAMVVAAGCSSDAAKKGAATTGPPSTPSTPSTQATTPASRVATGASKVAAPGTYAVGSRQETYVDRSRPTNANRTAPRLPERTLPTLVLYPAQGPPGYATASANAPPQPGPWPLIVFSHGVTGTGPDYATTLRVWASAGYVVIAPNYPLSNRKAAGGPSVADIPAQTADISFLISQLLDASAGTGPLHGLVDADRIGLAGHSLGAITTLGSGYNTCCADPRVKAVAEWAGIFIPLGTGGKVATLAAGRPLLIVHGDQDKTVGYSNANGVYTKVGAPKFFITLPGQGHVPSYVQGVGTPSSKVTTLATLDFFDRFLKSDRAGLDRFHSVVSTAGPTVARLQEDAG